MADQHEKSTLELISRDLAACLVDFVKFHQPEYWNEVDILTKFRLFNKFFSLFFLLEAILEIGLSDTPWDRGSS